MHQSTTMDGGFELQINLEQSNGHMSIKLRSKSFMILLHFSALTLSEGLCNQPKWTTMKE
jgi:hypothetical protein